MGKLSINLPEYTVEHTMQTFSEVYDWGLRDLNVPDIHKKTLGEDIKIAVIDSGKSEHFETADAVLGAKNFSPSSVVEDKNGHSCVHPDAFIWTSRGLEQIRDFYSRIEKPEMVYQEIEDSSTKYVGNCGIHCHSFNKSSKKFEFDSIEYVHKVLVNDEILRVHFGNNRSVKLTKDHPTYVLRDNDVQVVDAQELEIGDKLICDSEMSDFLCKVPEIQYGCYLECNNCGHEMKIVKFHKGRRQCKKCNKSNWISKNYVRKVDEAWSYLTGIILSDGHIHYKPRQRFIQICNTDDRIISHAERLFRNHGFEPSIYTTKDSNVKTLVVRSKELCEFFIEIGISPGNKTRIAEVPKYIQSAPSRLVLPFLAGLIDGDGSIGTDSKVRIATGSHIFAEQFTYWMISRGLRANYSYVSGVEERELRGKQIEFGPSWHITLYNPPGISKWMASSKKNNLKPDISRRATITITDIQKEPFDGYFYDLTMKNNANYTGNGVVVSNTFCAGIIAARKNDQGIIGVAPLSKLYFGKAMDDSGRGDPSALVKAVNWAAQQGVDIMSISAGMFFDFKPLRKAIRRAYKRNIIIVAAVGNCLAKGTRIKTPDGWKNIEDIQAGEKVYSFSLDEKTLQLQEVRNTFSRFDTVYRLKTFTRSISATKNHRFLCATSKNGSNFTAKVNTSNETALAGKTAKDQYFYEWKELKDIASGNFVLVDKSADSVFHSHPEGERHYNYRINKIIEQNNVVFDRVQSIEEIGEDAVFDLEVPELSNFVANNIVVHNSGTRQYDVAFPARYPEVIGVAAYDQRHKVAKFSSRGINVSFAMPGVNIYSTYLNNQFCKLNGTCLPASEMVYTPNGPISISLLRKGDEVYSFNELSEKIEPRKVLNHWAYDKKQCIDIHTPHTKIRCTENHPILVKEDDRLIWKKADTIQKHDLIITTAGISKVSKPIINIRDDWNASLLKPVKPKRGEFKKFKALESTISGFLSGKHGLRYELSKEIIKYYGIPDEDIVFGMGKKHNKTSLPQMDADLAYLCGFFLGDGWITKPVRNNKGMGARLYFAVCNLDHVNLKLESTFKEVFLTELGTRRNNQYELCNTVIANIFEDLCGHKKAKHKEIPSWVYSLDHSILLSFLSGLVDSDGWITKSGYGFSSSSRKLTIGVATILDFLGNRRANVGSRTRKIQAPNSKIPILASEHSITFRRDDENGVKLNENCLNKFEKYSDIATISSIRTQKVMKIKQAGKHTVYDIEVEGNHNFIANNIIVHNSFACPIMAGICALILSKHRQTENTTTPCETPKQMVEHLKKYAKKLNGQKETGFGTIDLEEAFSDA